MIIARTGLRQTGMSNKLEYSLRLLIIIVTYDATQSDEAPADEDEHEHEPGWGDTRHPW
jgi:hypothetical protein